MKRKSTKTNICEALNIPTRCHLSDGDKVHIMEGLLCMPLDNINGYMNNMPAFITICISLLKDERYMEYFDILNRCKEMMNQK